MSFTPIVQSMGNSQTCYPKRLANYFHSFRGSKVLHDYIQAIFTQNLVLKEAPWFIKWKFMHAFAWDPTFGIIGNYRFLPIWIELPFRSAIFESSKCSLAEHLDLVLVYLNSDQYNDYPNEHACILWDISKTPPYSLKIEVAPNIHIWKPIIF